MSKHKKNNRPSQTADKVELMSKTVAITEENQNQRHTIQKAALGPNTKR